ncbi:hypothetical protein BJ742DRAFT_743213 [Cladochytrium replicatum]|nr:hypothetical protein BJ742DRAFT_743213 [Cladochytrium replicatum]
MRIRSQMQWRLMNRKARADRDRTFEHQPGSAKAQSKLQIKRINKRGTELSTCPDSHPANTLPGPPQRPSPSNPSSFFNRILGTTQLAITSPTTTTTTPTTGAMDSSSSPPAPPSRIDPTDHLGLAIYYHEQNSLAHSAFHLRRSAIEDAPRSDTTRLARAAVEHLEGGRGGEEGERWGRGEAEEADTDYPKGRLGRGGPQGQRDGGEDPQSIEAARAIVPLPMYEIGMSFRHGWGVPVCEDAAAYYLTLAAHLGDADACTELGYCNLHGLSPVPKPYFLL